jgi:hypothetical protein
MAIGVAKNMKETFKDCIKLSIHTNDSPEAAGYMIKSATNVFLNGEMVPLNVALSVDRMLEYLKKRI